MAISFNTNIGAMNALQVLNRINQDMETTQMRITTGLKVNSAKDDASSYAIAQTMRGDVAGYEAVKSALGLAQASVTTALKAGESIADLMIEAKALVQNWNTNSFMVNDGNSNQAFNDKFNALMSQIDVIASSATFNGTNLIQCGASSMTVISTVEGSSMSISAQDLSVTALGIWASGTTTVARVDAAFDLINQRLGSLGQTSKMLDIQKSFVSNLSDILKEGIGTIVDADMAQESAKLQSLQIQQQLGVQALSIANQTPQSLLSLFR